MVDQVIRGFPSSPSLPRPGWACDLPAQIKLALLPVRASSCRSRVIPVNIWRMAMPAFSLGFPVADDTASSEPMVEELDKTMYAPPRRRVPKRVVIARNVFRNALITPVTVLGMKIGYHGRRHHRDHLPAWARALFEGINGTIDSRSKVLRPFPDHQHHR